MACCKKAKALRQRRLKEAAEMRQIASNPEWQIVRKRLVGTWLKQPEWACEQVKDYLGKLTETTKDKLRIVRNYLNAGGFRSKKIQHSCIQKLKSQISMELKKRDAVTK